MSLPSRSLVRVYFVLVLSCLALVLPGARAAEKWLHGSSQHFEILSSASEKDTRRIVTRLELFRENILPIFTSQPTTEPRVTVVLFGSDSAFTPFKPRYRGQTKEVSGYFSKSPDEVFIAMCTDYDSETGNDPEEIILHEYLHLLVHSQSYTLPTWLDEGLAEVFSTFQVSGNVVEYGQPKDHYVHGLQFSAMMPLGRLLAADNSSVDYNEEQRASTFYAQSWLLTHYLLCGKDRANAAKLNQFMDRMNHWSGNSTPVFKEIFGANLTEMEQQLRNYLEGGQFYKRRSPLRPIDESKITFQPATSGERDVTLASLRWRVHRSAQDVPPLFALVEREPTMPGPHETLAAVAMEKGDTESAVTHWRRAAELKTKNAFVYMELANQATRRFALTDFDERLPVVEALDLQRWLDRALALRPGYPEAIEALAVVESRAPSLRVYGINAVQNGVPRLKDRDRTLFSLAVIRWRANDPATCLSIVDALLNSDRTDPKVRVAARTLRLRVSESSPSNPAAGAPAARRS